MNLDSGIAWLATSDKEIAKARGLLSALTQEGVLDELGFLVLLGSISDRLYPAINTIMTRARYLVFIPAIFRHIEERGLAKNRSADKVSRDFQFKLRNALLETDPRAEGVIGKEAGLQVARVPSNTYWNALGELGIGTSRISEGSYLERLSKGEHGQSGMKDDDNVVHDVQDDAFWDPNFRTPDILSDDGHFRAGTSFALTKSEATQLHVRYKAVCPDGEQSLISHLLEFGIKHPSPGLDFQMPWNVSRISAELQLITEHARCLSLFVRGSTLQYHAMLFEKRLSRDTGTQPAFEHWWELAKTDLAAWDLATFVNIPCIRRALRIGDHTFLDEWCRAITCEPSAAAAFASSRAREIIQRRESTTRKHKSRLVGGFHLRSWNEPVGYDPEQIYGLSYRHARGIRFAKDIVDALHEGNR